MGGSTSKLDNRLDKVGGTMTKVGASMVSIEAADALWGIMVDFGQWVARLDIDPEARVHLNAAMRHLARVRAYLDTAVVNGYRTVPIDN